jgi:hypothetical protein
MIDATHLELQAEYSDGMPRQLIANWLKGNFYLEPSLHESVRRVKTIVTQVPKDLNAILSKLGLLPLFSQPPTWAPGVCSK